MLESLLPFIYGAIGGLVASYAAARFQRNNWLFQKKLEGFAKLIETLEGSREKILAYYYEELGKKELIERVDRDFLPVSIQQRIASFFANDETAEEMANKLADIHMAFSGSKPNFEKWMMSTYIFSVIRELQEILEDDAKRAGWYARWKHRRRTKKRFREEHKRFLEWQERQNVESS
jgi:hypothetical protein